jgi:large-conductance mechanosensitive channel
MDRSFSHQFLDPQEVTRTIERLSHRIRERFPNAHLAKVCQQILTIAQQTQARASSIAQPAWGLRIITALLVLLILTGSAGTVALLRIPNQAVNLGEFVQILEASINDLILIGAAIFFLVTLETRIKRRRALAANHELRSIAHVIDMHQLTKDPERILFRGHETTSSPRQELSYFELNRYLDYCTELLSLTGKLAALHVQNFDDSVALASANEVESLCTGLSQKIWQKIMILHALNEQQSLPPAQEDEAP